MGDRVHQVVEAAHGRQISGGKLVQRQVHGAAPAVTRLGGHIPPFEHLRPVDVRVVPSFRPAVLRLMGPVQEAVYGALRAVTVPQEQAEAQGRGFSWALCRAAHRALVPTMRLAWYPSTGLPVKLSQVAYLASHRMPGTNSSTKTKSLFIASRRPGPASRAGR